MDREAWWTTVHGQLSMYNNRRKYDQKGKGKRVSAETNTYDLKVKNYVLFGDIIEDYITWNISSQIALRNCSKEAREKPGYTAVLGFVFFPAIFAENKNQTSQNTHTSLVTLLMLSYVWEDAGPLKLPL